MIRRLNAPFGDPVGFADLVDRRRPGEEARAGIPPVELEQLRGLAQRLVGAVEAHQRPDEPAARRLGAGSQARGLEIVGELVFVGAGERVDQAHRLEGRRGDAGGSAEQPVAAVDHAESGVGAGRPRPPRWI